MTSPPPPYPRIPHLVSGRGTRDDQVLAPGEAASLLSGEVVVEEKLDGANVALWVDGGAVQVALRSGPGSMDRAGQLGPLRAWVGQHHHALSALLLPGLGLYAEWLYLAHTLTYDRLESLLVALDLRREDGSFLAVDQRNAVCATAGLAVPPELWRGVPHKVQVIEGLLGPSRYTPAPAEGVVVRSTDGSGQQIAKLIQPNFAALGDEGWRSGRPHNRLSEQGLSWH